MNWLYYLVEANLYLVVFYGFYRLFLQNETFYSLNRYFLLLSTVISFLLPIIQLGFLKPALYQVEGNMIYELPPPPMEPSSPATLSNSFADVNWLYVFYLLIAFGFAIKLSFSIYRIIKIWSSAKKHTAGAITLIEVNDESTAFSFFNLLFIHPALADQPTVLKHEMVHIKQKHSFDVLFFELVQVICWFNPSLYFIKKDIKLLHEYIADELTTNADIQKHEYALFLIQNSFGLRAQPITNQIFNQSILKRRINMLNKKRTAGWARLRLLLALPLTGSMLCISTMAFTKDYGYVDLLPEKSEFASPVQDKPKVENNKKSSAPKVQTVKKDQIKFPPPLVKRDQIKFPPTFKPKDQHHYVVYYRTEYKTGKQVRIDNRYVVVNGKPIDDQENFYGATNTESITHLNVEEAKKRYGSKGVNGAVVITGSDIKFLDAIVAPPPPRVTTVKFPAPVGKFKQKYFTPGSRTDKVTGMRIVFDTRYIVVNGNPIEDNSKFYGVTQTETVTYLSPAQAIKVYGEEKGKNGAVEIIGSNVYFNKENDQIKFPPPIVKADKPSKLLKSPPPPVEPPPAPKREQVKFPPPIVKADKPSKLLKSPPPPVEPPPAPKRDQVKFPPPVVKSDKGQVAPPPPIEPLAPKKNISTKTPSPQP
ncbi:MAG: M56 family metallopeptidase [Bacteroidia bacterium]